MHLIYLTGPRAGRAGMRLCIRETRTMTGPGNAREKRKAPDLPPTRPYKLVSRPGIAGWTITALEGARGMPPQPVSKKSDNHNAYQTWRPDASGSRGEILQKAYSAGS